MSWVCSMLIFALIVLVILLIAKAFVLICDLLNLDALYVAMIILFMALTGFIIYAIHEIVF